MHQSISVDDIQCIVSGMGIGIIYFAMIVKIKIIKNFGSEKKLIKSISLDSNLYYEKKY